MDYSKMQQSPMYQRATQKLRRLDPSQKAILDSAFIDREFARSESGKTLKGMQLSINRKQTEMNQQNLDREYASSVKDRSRTKKDTKRATLLGGANVLASGYFGYKENQRLNRLADLIAKQTKKY